jgi:hypothetical protein
VYIRGDYAFSYLTADILSETMSGTTLLFERVYPGGPYDYPGPEENPDVFVTTPGALDGLTTPNQVAGRLGIPSAPSLTIIEFPTPSEGLASPINRLDPGFIGNGSTSGGAPEFVIPNQPLPPLWERTYPHGTMQGGGPAQLRCLSLDEAHAKYEF